MPPHLRKPRLRRSEVPEYLMLAHGYPIAVSTLEKLACTGGGPHFSRIGGRTIVYAKPDLDEWAIERIGKPVRSTSDKSAL